MDGDADGEVRSMTFSPGSGFVGARFDFLGPRMDISTNRYLAWSVNRSWLGVNNNGQVTFREAPSSLSDAVATITFTNTRTGETRAQRISLTHWFVNEGATTYTYRRGALKCADYSGTRASYELPTRAQFTSLRSDWGAPGRYANTGFRAGAYITQDRDAIGATYFTMNLATGNVTSVNFESATAYLACVTTMRY